MYQHLLVPIDGSEVFDRAVEASIELARRLGASITAFVAEPTTPPPATGLGTLGYVRAMEQHDSETADHASTVLAEFEKRAGAAGVRFEGMYARTQQVATAIVETARARGCDLIVMATHGRSAFGELVWGSHTKGVLARSRLPLLVLH